jgi:hypothetical protein
MSTLYDLREQLAGLSALLESDEGITPEMIADTLQGLEGEFQAKAERVVHAIINRRGRMEALTAEIERLGAIVATEKSKDEALKNYLVTNMAASGITKIECPLFTVSTRKPPLVAVIDDETRLPGEMVTTVTTTKVDKKALLAELKNGPVDGAHLENGNMGLVIK